MSRRTADIFSQFEHIRERMEQAYQQVIGVPGRPHFRVPIMEPSVDVYETDNEVVVIVEMPGIAREEVSLEVSGTMLTLKGERRPITGRPRRVYSQMEICDGPFQREVLLPAAVDPEKVYTVYRDGMLEIALPKASPAPSQQLKIVVR